MSDGHLTLIPITSKTREVEEVLLIWLPLHPPALSQRLDGPFDMPAQQQVVHLVIVIRERRISLRVALDDDAPKDAPRVPVCQNLRPLMWKARCAQSGKCKKGERSM